MLYSVQYLRAVAAISVVLFHIWPVFLPETTNIISFGAAGVDIFFVISGFIMWHITSGKLVRPGEFLLQRLVRVAPLYWLVTLMLATVSTIKPNLFPLDHPTISHVLMSLLFIPHIAHGAVEVYPLLRQGWTLTYEMLFYLLFFVTLFLRMKYRFTALSAIVIALAGYGIFFKPANVFGAWITSSLLFEFYMGILISIFVQRGWVVTKFASVTIAVCAAALIVAVPKDAVESSRVLCWGIPAAILVWAAISCEKIGVFGKNRAFMLLGNASYSIYLVHFLASSLVDITLRKLQIANFGVPQFLIASAFAILCGIAMYLWVEIPLLSTARRYIKTTKNTKDVQPVRI